MDQLNLECYSPEVETDLSKFSLEVNSSSIPFDYSKRNTKKPAPKERSTSLTWINKETGEFLRTETIIKPINGDSLPGALAQDVLTVLFTLAVEQKSRQEPGTIEAGRIKVWYSLAEICRRLRLSTSSNRKVKFAIEELENISVWFKDFICESSGYKTENIKTRIITRSGRIKSGRHGDYAENSNERWWVEFDGRVAQSLFDGLYGTLSRDVYLQLSSGACRGLYNILCTKRRMEGDRFIVDVDEIIKKLSLRSNPRRARHTVKKYIKTVSESCDGFSYYFTNINKRSVVKIIFNDSDSGTITDETFFGKLVSEYGRESLASVGLERHDIEYILEQNLEDKYIFNGRKILASELCIDIALHQVLVGGYNSLSIKGLIRDMLKKVKTGELIIPDSYRDFINSRIEKRKDEAVIKEIEARARERKRKEEEETQFIQMRSLDIFNKIKESSPKLMKKLKSDAYIYLSRKEGNERWESMIDSIKNMMIDARVKAVISEKIKTGDLDSIGANEEGLELKDVNTTCIKRPSILDTMS